MVTSEKHQKSLLGGIERFVGLSHPDLLSSVPKILMELYQADLLEEDVIKQWGTHVSKKYVDKETSKKVRKSSEPFLKVRAYAFSIYYICAYNMIHCSGLKRLMMMTTTTTMRMRSEFIQMNNISIYFCLIVSDMVVIWTYVVRPVLSTSE
jgi:hypothetical protein